MIGIRFRSKNHIKREDCKNLINSIVEDNISSYPSFSDGLKDADIFYEVSKGKIKAFCILANPIVSNKISEIAKNARCALQS